MTRPKPLPVTPKPATIPFAKSLAASQADIDRPLETLPTGQRDRIEAVMARGKPRGKPTDMKVTMEGNAIAVSYANENPEAAALLLMADLGTMDPAFHFGITGQVARIGNHGAKIDEANSNFLLSVVRAIQPRDELETMLAVQMGAIHAATMMMARRLNHVDTIPQQDAAERALNKLARTYAGQMEALKRYRTGGQQRVIVEHVTVNAGGQAIVGAVTRGPGGTE
jgi:hypothetical protein